MKHSPVDIEHYTIYPSGIIVSHKGWRGNVSKAIRPYLHNGYPAFNLTIHGQRKRWHLHKLMAEIFLGERPTSDHVLRHLDGNVKNNSVENLTWGTSRENADDRERHGRTSRGPVHSTRIKKGVAIAKANAHLIAAAPEMLEALEEAYKLLAVSDYKNDQRFAFEVLSPLLTKARGEP